MKANPAAELVPSPGRRSANNSILPLAVLVLVGGIILTVGIRVNYVNIDEVYFADPVINWLTGKGYTTSVWDITGASQTHVSTAPAYSLLLMLWLKIFGISQPAVRTLSAMLALVSAGLFWQAGRRTGLLHSGAAGAMLIGITLLDYGYAFSYSVGRPDALSALLVAAMFYFYTLSNRRRALAGMGFIALVFPFVQWGCVIYFFLLSIALVLILGRKFVPYMTVVGMGLAIGLMLQRGVYAHYGLWNTWMNTINSEGSDNLMARIVHRLDWRTLLRHNSNVIPKDFSVLVLLAGLIVITLRGKWLNKPAQVALGNAALILAGVVVTGMYFFGKFPTYYGWMLCLPLALLTAFLYDQNWQGDRLAAKLAGLTMLLAAIVGLPLQAGLASHDWQERQRQKINGWLATKIDKNDVVYCDYPFYYIAKERAKAIYVGKYCHKLSPQEVSGITLAIIGSQASEWSYPEVLTNKILIGRFQPAESGIVGNSWQFGILSAPNYSCTVYKF
jgi:hypothetical protein